ncbi:LysR family transcriptional regulator [Devosia epidermidihirudinis]|uniref:LysR family transcriptional regulator n=1 Tax=Devosia epidermidihirudinis TaxID=1293439 RepID=A0A0F5QF47_9HYPH|nr:LysR substrate-binding domain-containing protein [Devosia epidermidihirudinis]KKC39343.1 LysR family transcriptional regulator [Devosia epidermidihirudinis]
MARQLPSLNALRAFEAAGRHGRMTLAADELNVTHSAISRQVQNLENLLGVALFEGPRNRLQLTEAGVRLLGGLGAAFDQIDLAVRAVADTGEGVLDVSCPGTFTMRWLIPRLYRFHAAHPEIDVRLSASSKPVDFSRDGFDVAIRAGAAPWPEDALLTPLFAEQIGPVLSPDLAANLTEGFVGMTRLHSRSRRHAWRQWGERAGVALQDSPGNEYEHFYFMLEAASSGLGVCIAPWPLVADDVRTGRLVAPFGFVDSGQGYVALQRTRRQRRATLFCEWLARESEAFVAP